MPDNGHIELERSVDSIIVGTRHRKDLGDLDPLMRSIERLGMLQPITVAPDGVLLCGRRRLEAIRRLNRKTVRVWVRSGLSDRLNSLLALQDENTLHKPLSPIEAVELYRELKTVMAEDAARRQRATRFGAQDGHGMDGGGDSPPPGEPGKTGEQAAKMVTGADSHQRLERVARLQDLAGDEAQPETLRELAVNVLSEISEGAPVSPSFKAVTEVSRHAAGERSGADELERLAREALERIRRPRSRRQSSTAAGGGRSLRSFVHTWADLDGWSAHYDPAEVGPALSADDWAQFERVLQETTTFAVAARQARNRSRESVEV